jgi:hypothetical protein
LLTRAGHIDAQTGWGIEKFVSAARSQRIVKIEAANQARTAADPLSRTVIKIRADVRSNLSQVE